MLRCTCFRYLKLFLNIRMCHLTCDVIGGFQLVFQPAGCVCFFQQENGCVLVSKVDGCVLASKVDGCVLASEVDGCIPVSKGMGV
jgi:hypothetical protein